MPGSSTPLILRKASPKTNLFQLLPWDLDLTFGRSDGMGADPEKLSIMHPWSGPNLFLARLFKLDEFKQIYLAKMKELSKTVFLPARIGKQVDELAAILRPAVEEESKEMLAKFDLLAAGKSSGSGNLLAGGMDAGREGFWGMPGSVPQEGFQNAPPGNTGGKGEA
jgi:hypothetical protein